MSNLNEVKQTVLNSLKTQHADMLAFQAENEGKGLCVLTVHDIPVKQDGVKLFKDFNHNGKPAVFVINHAMSLLHYNKDLKVNSVELWLETELPLLLGNIEMLENYQVQ